VVVNGQINCHQIEFTMSNPWEIEIDAATGALARLAHPADPEGMNWVCGRRENAWFPRSYGWGLGHVAMPGYPAAPRWEEPAELGGLNVRYRVGRLDISVTRTVRGEFLDESFLFQNNSEEELPIWGIGLCTPFNDNYPDAPTCVSKRCHAHIWCGGHVAYVCALRMGARAPHLGWVLTRGKIGGYSIHGRGLQTAGSNTRGIIILNAEGATLQPGESLELAATMFWHQGWDDFLTIARTIPGFVEVTADCYTLVGAEEPEIRISEPGAVVGEAVMEIDGERIPVHLPDGRETWLRVQRIADVGMRVQARAAFIAEKQIVREVEDPLHGAILSYDNDTRARFHNPKWPDQGEGREHVGMGVLLAQAGKRWNDAVFLEAAELNRHFVRKHLQDADGTVFDSARDHTTQRLYNYPWVAQLHLELGDLQSCLRTFQQYYARGGANFYAFPIPMLDAVNAFRSAGQFAEAEELLGLFRGHADRIVAIGTDIPAHEVNYEQTIIGPATLIPLEVYLLTHEEKYLQCAESFLPLLDAFNGRQPDHHLHDIAIRHWDGFWFGRLKLWGDTFPHYWSALTGWVFYRYWQATGQESYRQRGREILLGNLSAFRPDGSASCAYLYPDAINGNPARCWDPLANDQDWAMVFLLQAAQLDPEFEKKLWT
jgi:hypothetical protein